MRRLIRSALFVPASNPRAIAKAAHVGADLLILDLEDAVGPEEKQDARELVDDTLRQWDVSGAIRAVRINSLETEWGAADIRAAARADAVVLPKVEQVGDLHAARSALSSHGSSVPIWAMIETPRALMALNAISGAVGTGLAGLVAGTNDLCKALRCSSEQNRLALVPHLASLVCAARARGLYVLDGVYNHFRDPKGFRAEAEQGRLLGFDGKTLIHPGQVDLAHLYYGPTSRDLEQAAKIVAAFADPQNAGKGVISLDGDMVERLHLEAARALLSTASENDS
ncbi:CoA ester lyase [Maricaulis sp.]|uniref:HpcH/HpaI aldolase/citrate lyase family protein n=1 Tax=Maricaulis sp. TaxID=1486257 RepID=UPI0025BE394D|nr:CoA ester lyase [Maricaulis sp.]